ncbi:MAG: hypothetical protein PF961_10200 [Planctomycetota bacterium]|jgi:hypothetical protein|nr:hypothetical protein [Planctomycetota bacterium]
MSALRSQRDVCVERLERYEYRGCPGRYLRYDFVNTSDNVLRLHISNFGTDWDLKPEDVPTLELRVDPDTHYDRVLAVLFDAQDVFGIEQYRFAASTDRR